VREGGVSRGVFKLHYKILHRLGLAMDLGGSYNEAAILIASHRLPGGVRPWALLSRQVSAALVSLPLAWVTRAEKFRVLIFEWI